MSQRRPGTKGSFVRWKVKRMYDFREKREMFWEEKNILRKAVIAGCALWVTSVYEAQGA